MGFDEIMFLQSSVQTCIRVADLKTCGMRRKKGWLFDISLLLGLYAGLIVFYVGRTICFVDVVLVVVWVGVFWIGKMG